MIDIGFIGLGTMGRPMAGHLQAAGHRLFLHDVVPIAPELVSAGGVVCKSGKEVAEQAGRRHHHGAGYAACRSGAVRKGRRRGRALEGQIVVDMSSISPLATKEFAKKIEALGADYLDAPVSGGEVGAKAASLTIMVGGPERAFNAMKPVFDKMGKNVTLVGANGDGQTTKVANQIIVGADDRGGRRGAAVRIESRRGSGAGAAGADGRLCIVADSRSARRAHGEAQLRTGLPYRAAPEGSQSGAGGRACARHFLAQHGGGPAIVQLLRRPWRQGVGPFGHGARAGDDGEPSGRQRLIDC